MKTVVDEIAEYLKTFGIVLNKKTVARYKEKEKHQIIDFSLKVKNESGPEAYIEINNLYNETFS